VRLIGGSCAGRICLKRAGVAAHPAFTDRQHLSHFGRGAPASTAATHSVTTGITAHHAGMLPEGADAPGVGSAYLLRRSADDPSDMRPIASPLARRSDPPRAIRIPVLGRYV